METHGIAVFDVCHTLTRTNNTSAFVGFVLKKDRSLRYGLFVLLRMLSLLFRLPGIRCTLRRARRWDGQIVLLRGYSPAHLAEHARQYVDHLFARNLLHDRVLEVLRQEKAQGRTVYLVSAAVDPPIRELAGRLGIENHFSSELEVKDGRCTGRLRTDLFGRKGAVLERMPGNVDWQVSAVYSDDMQDADFMARFGRRYAVVNTCKAHARWNDKGRGFRFLVNYEEPSAGQDPDSVTARTAPWIYVPFLYYAVSRLHRQGVHSLLLREIVPVTVTAWLFMNRDARTLLLLPLSFLMFFCVYEIGGLVNDLCAHREDPAQRISRIAPGVQIHAGLFVAIRVALVGLLSAWLGAAGYAMGLYAGTLAVCLIVYLLHTLILGNLRVLTFLGLRICRSSIPWFILASRLPPATLIGWCAVFFLADAPGRLYVYSRRRGLVHGTIPTWQVRSASAVLLGGLGAVLYVRDGSPWLLAVAVYYLVLEGLWGLRGRGPTFVRT
ncbi:MAG: haloacid dehalogenase-like hydrolase [Planctomycetes bacterium]|jgi:phosphoserine phosphatase|nr:haloacid dehalogenase-like hydrolase [Planctomycetota bacterium]